MDTTSRSWGTGKWAGWALAVCLTMGMAACGGGGDDAAPPSPSGTATVGAEGGTLSNTDGVSLVVPPGSLSETVTLRVARDATGLNAALQGGTPEPDKAVAVSPTYAMTPHGTVFARPVELRIPIDTAAAAGPGLLVVLRTDPGRDGWDVLPIQKIENGQAVVSISSFSFYRVIRITGLVINPTMLPVPPVLEMSMTLGGAAPSEFTWVRADGTPQSATPQRRLYGNIANRTDSLRLSGRIVGLPAACSKISLAGRVMPTQNATAADTSSTAWGIGRNNLGEPIFAEVNATVGSVTTAGVTRPVLSFAFDINIDTAPFKVELFRALRASNTTGPTPPIGLNFNAYAQCGNDVDLGGGLIVHNWMVVPGMTPYLEGNQQFLDPHDWLWNTVLFTTDYLPQGIVTLPQDVTVAAGMPASFSTSAWSAPEGESRIEWWRSDNEGVTWSRVRTTLVPIPLTSDTYTLPVAALSDNNALFRVRQCGVPRTAALEEGCTDSNAARLTVLQGVSAASFSQQPRPVLVRTGQTATFSVAVSGAPGPSVRWQARPANSSGAWADVSTGSGAATLNYTTAALALGDNGLQLRAVANNVVGDVASVPVTVSVSDVDVAPSISSQPAALSVVAGSEAVFAVVARGTEALSYQWRRNGVAITGANAPVLKLAAVSEADATGYSVQVSNTAGTATSDAAQLSVSAGAASAVAPTIVTQPVSVLVNSGNTATFAVGVSGSGPLSYQWLRNASPISGATSAFYSIAAVAVGDAATYSVQVSNSVSSATSWNVVLTVNQSEQPAAVTLVSHPSPQIQPPGGSATFAVAATGSGPITYQWLKDGAPLAGATGAVLTLTNLVAEDGASYSVAATNPLGTVTSDAATLTVLGVPVITSQPTGATAAVGGSASFSVMASGAGLRYQWLRNGVAISGAQAASFATPALALGDSGAVYGVMVYNGAGIVFSQSAVLTVTAALAQWQAAAAIETDDTGNAQQPSISVNAAGEAVAVWMQPGGGVGNNIWANRYTPAGGWGTAQRISDGQGGAQNAQAVAVDASGNAMAVWQQADNIWANRYTAGSGWGTPLLIETSSGWAGNPQVGLDANGNALAVWWQREGARTNIEAAHYAVGAGWGTPTIIENDDSGGVSAPRVAVDAAGNAMAVWAWSADTGGNNFIYNVWANRYVAGVGWGSAGPLDSSNVAQPDPQPRIALDTNGNAIAVWHRRDSGIDHVMSNRYSAGVGWGTAALLETDPAVISRNASVAIDPAGNALAVWEQYAGATANVMASRYTAGGTWDAPALIETDNAGTAYTPQIVIDSNGIGTALWSQRNVGGFTVNVWTNRYVPGSGWGTAVEIDGQAQPATHPVLGVDASGRIVAVWEQMVGSLSHLWASAFR